MTSLRVISGSLKGRPLKTSASSATRPTTALLRKAVFDTIQPVIANANFLDLFAGSGAMGIEAISRGARHSTFIESHKEALKCLQANLKTLHLERVSTLLSYDFHIALKKLTKEEEIFDLVYVDPPYEKKEIYQEILTFFDTGALLHSGSLLFLEEPSPSSLSHISLHRLKLQESRRYGKSLLHRYRF
jgi:16S rRNA (guanine966-N2)-methyltransferase